MADHNDPNAVNSIFSDIDLSAADVYDLFGFPADDAPGDTVVLMLTFAPVPEPGTLDPDLLYRLRIAPGRRVRPPTSADHSLDTLLKYFDSVKDKFRVEHNAREIRVRRAGDGVRIDFTGFVTGDFSATLGTDEVHTLREPGGKPVKVFIGGRDDAFFNDLPGFFRSINYAPQFYHVPHTRTDARELPIPKTLLELEGNHLFNFDPAEPRLGRGVKKPLPPGPLTWSGTRFARDADGDFRFVYSGEDAQAGRNINAIIVELPLSLITREPDADRIVNLWGESWVRKASDKVETVPDNSFWRDNPLALWDPDRRDEELRRYKLVDTVGQPFADAALNEREDSRQVGADNFWLAPHFVKRLAHLGWGFGPSITALGLVSSFDHDNSPVSVHRTYATPIEAFPRVKRTIFQALTMPDNSWNPKGLDIPLRRPYEIFIPNVCAIDMDTTGTWPFGRRPEDQVATRFLSLFLDHEATIDGRRYHIDLLGEQALWDAAPIKPKTPPNPLHNDKEFLTVFPYLATPW
ncbi:DUF4331 family protein [Actinoplanes sp. N902-109]|uniref:DUF4331 family protein n=1 Tax=Actinoplanes sp. (strain N902-109) TaxID=649831 RepID=UPI00032967F9|nr:DUF4331 family protein [Actinoplanes sp. N902-109]AGL19309.1 hypothetical protein L083_5799 [Actinoplanes sp. N902-109]